MSVGEPGEHSAGRLSACGQRAAGSLEHRIHRSATRKENWKKRERLDAPDRRQRVTPASIVVRRTSGVDRSDARQMASTLPHHVQHELGTQEQGPKTVRERELAASHLCREVQTDRQLLLLFLFLSLGVVPRQSRKGARNGFLASIRRRRPRGGLADIRRGGTPPARRPRRRRRYSARAVKVRRRPRSPNSAAPACQLAATPPSLACRIRHHRPRWLRPCVPAQLHCSRAPPTAACRQAQSTPSAESSSSASSRCLRARRRSSQPPS